jgi:hypothetical protein
MFKKVQALQKVAQTVASPITQAANVIKTTFKPKPKKPNIGGTKKSDQIKKSNKMIKDLDKTMKKDLTPEMREKGEKLKKEIKQTQKQIYKADFKKGGPVKKKKKKKKFPDLTGDGKVTFADVLKGRGVINGKKKKKKVI